MSGYIVRGTEKSVVLRAADVDTLLSTANGDAALLYLALMRADGGLTQESLQTRLGLSALRFDAAETALQQAGLLPGGKMPPPPEPERRPYSAQEMAQMLCDKDFMLLRGQIEDKLGKRLSSSDDQILASLYRDLPLSADVIYLLVCHCLECTQQRLGPGRIPTLRRIEKEAYYWVKLGVTDQQSAAQYLRSYRHKLTARGAYMQVLGLGDRAPVDAEARYLSDWMDKGFPPETVALAYERTVLRKQTLDWRYLNGILRRWHESGLHSPEEVERSEQKRSAEPSQAQGRDGGNDWMKRYTKR